jgi:hypothetical protein
MEDAEKLIRKAQVLTESLAPSSRLSPRYSFSTSLSTDISYNIPISSSPTMLLPVYNIVAVLVFSFLVSGDDARRCRQDTCLRSFNQNHEQAETYCASHPNRFLMAPAPLWADGCQSLGRMNNKRQRLASACSCLDKPSPTDEATSIPESISSTAVSTASSTEVSAFPSINAAATYTEIRSSIMLPATSAATSSDLATPASDHPPSTITTTASVNGVAETGS